MAALDEEWQGGEARKERAGTSRGQLGDRRSTSPGRACPPPRRALTRRIRAAFAHADSSRARTHASAQKEELARARPIPAAALPSDSARAGH